MNPAIKLFPRAVETWNSVHCQCFHKFSFITLNWERWSCPIFTNWYGPTTLSFEQFDRLFKIYKMHFSNHIQIENSLKHPYKTYGLTSHPLDSCKTWFTFNLLLIWYNFQTVNIHTYKLYGLTGHVTTWTPVRYHYFLNPFNEMQFANHIQTENIQLIELNKTKKKIKSYNL